MFSDQEVTKGLETCLRRMVAELRLFFEGLSSKALFHELVELAAERARCCARVMVEAASQLRERRIRKVTPHCPRCKKRMKRTRMVRIQPNTSVGEVSVRRQHFQCRRCLSTRSPFDEQMGLTGTVCESLVRQMALLGASLPYRQVASTLDKLLGVDVSAKTCQTKTNAVAHDLLKRENEAIERLFDRESRREEVLTKMAATPFRLYISMDGAMANIRDENWKEIRVGALWTETVEQSAAKAAGQKASTRANPSYVIRFDKDDLGRATYVRAVELGLRKAHEVVVIADGAPWIWNLAAEHFPEATGIVDWFHAIQRICKAANAIYDDDPIGARSWIRRRKANLKQGRPKLVVRALRRAEKTRGLAPDHAEVVRQATVYFTNNADRMEYNKYRERGSDIGSGRVEAACKRIIAGRLKTCGARWRKDNAEAIAVLRAAVLSGRLQRLWSQRDKDMRAAALRKAPRKAVLQAA